MKANEDEVRELIGRVEDAARHAAIRGEAAGEHAYALAFTWIGLTLLAVRWAFDNEPALLTEICDRLNQRFLPEQNQALTKTKQKT